jgi:hypothetical protein
VGQDPGNSTRISTVPDDAHIANQLVRQSGTQVSLTNADSYALLGVALLLNTCDWRDGACRSPGFYANLRQEQLEAAQALALLQGGMQP